MENLPTSNPFQPGTGTYPPVLAGREEEQSRLASLVRALAEWRQGRSLQAIHLIQAPRGMGKTVLLETLARQVDGEPAFSRVTVLRAPASSLATVEDIARCVGPGGSRFRAAWEWFAGLRLFVVRMQRPQPKEGQAAVRSAFDRRRRTPFLLLVDEAHTLRPEVCHVLLNEFQDRTGHQPCALVLAGTPPLKAFLLSEEVNASFAERAPVIAPGLLTPPDAAKALRVPMWDTWEVDHEVLQAAAEDSAGYPYFLQLWGEALWDAGRTRRTVDRQVLAAARERVDASRTEFYVNRLDEFEDFAVREGIDRQVVLAALRAVGSAVARPGAALARRELDGLLERSGLDSRTAAMVRGQIADKGFLVRHGGLWHVGIPSLATFVAHHAG